VFKHDKEAKLYFFHSRFKIDLQNELYMTLYTILTSFPRWEEKGEGLSTLKNL